MWRIIVMGMDETVAIAKALADRTRLRILMALTGGELCVCQIVEFCSLAPSTISKHLQILAGCGLISGRKDGRWVYYHLSEKDATKNVRGALKWLRSSFSDDAHSSIDMKTLEKVVAKDREALCRSQSKK
ncbi:MAG: winged helix-turn-helix transcriptional regulator [Deltaproteobacteria bacterium]|nr:winged helix-turn-helix transcriptional regulator [Deltaproteobacteria bacterium]